MRVIRGFLLLILAGAAMFPAAAMAAEQVDLLLVLAADVSRSVDNEKFQLQREGYAAAVSDPHVLDAIRSGRTGRIGLTYVEWSGIGSQRVVIDWTTISDAESAKGFGDRLLEAPRSFADRTSISGAIPVSRLRKNAQHLVSKFEFLLASTQIQHRKSLRHCLIQINARRPRRRSGIAVS